MPKPKLKKLYIRPVGGLANRMRAIESGYDFASACGALLVIVWEKNNILNATYGECFEPIPGVSLKHYDYSGYGLQHKLKRLFTGTLERAGRKWVSGKSMGDGDVKCQLTELNQPHPANRYFDELAERYEALYIETCYSFYPNGSFRLKIRKEILQEASRLVPDKNSMTGVHIRRTDNFLAIENSPLELYEWRIGEELRQFPDMKFYLSTDSDEVVSRLKNKFGDRIITAVSERRRDTGGGIRAALLDLCCLSQCRKILGSFYSSFSDRAAEMGNIPLEIISKKNSPTTSN